MKTQDEMRTQLIAKAAEDDTFRSQLLADPKPAIEAELGITIPQQMTVQVHENSAQTVHLVLPPATRLSDAELQATSGGDHCVYGV